VEAIYGTQLQRVALNHRISVFGGFPVTQDQKGRTIEGEIAPAAQVHIPILLPVQKLVKTNTQKLPFHYIAMGCNGE
jgi:hypothetical protein